MKKKMPYLLVSFVAVFVLHAIYSIWEGMRISNQWVQIEGITPLLLYLDRQDYLLGVSYAMAAAFTVYAFLKFLESRRSGISGVIGGITLTGILYWGGCFLLGCCGSPMLAVYLGVFGSSFLGFTKPLVLILTVTSVGIGYFWMETKTKTSKGCCGIGNEEHNKVNTMADKDAIKNIQSELQEGIALAKCRKCGCMNDTLEKLQSSLSSTKEASSLLTNIECWLKQMKSIKYDCLGCEHCFPAVAMNILHQAFPEVAQTQSLSCAFEVREKNWPPVAGEYFAFCDGSGCPVAVSTLASVGLAEKLATARPNELCIVGKTETENIGIEKLIKNTITNPTIRFLLLAGKDSQGHHSGRTLLSLWENGVDENMRIVGSPGRRPILRNVTREEVENFREQLQVVDMIDCEDVKSIVEEIKDISYGLATSGYVECEEKTRPVTISEVPTVHAKEPTRIEMDKAGYFVITPQIEKHIIIVEHYSYDNTLQRVLEGKDARSIYWTIIENGWVTQLSHAAYIGKELSKAELSMKFGFKYIQDGA